MLTVSRLILSLQSYWDAHGCALLQPYDVEVGAGTSHPATFFARHRPRTLARGVCAAIAPPQGRPLWRESKPAPALLSISSRAQTRAGRYPGMLSGFAEGAWTRFN